MFVEPSEFVLYQAQETARLTLSNPGQVIAEADNVLWNRLFDFEPMRPATDFLTPSEEEVLTKHLQLWDKNDVRKVQQSTLKLPLLYCKKQITLVTLDSAGGKSINAHPLIVRIEQQVKNHKELTCTPSIGEESYDSIEPLTNNAVCGSNGIYAEIERTDLIMGYKLFFQKLTGLKVTLVNFLLKNKQKSLINSGIRRT